MTRPARDLIQILGLEQSPLTLVSALAWLLEADGEHGLGDRVARGLERTLQRESEHRGTLADRDGVRLAAAALREQTMGAETRLAAHGPYVRLSLRGSTVAIVPCLDEPVPGAAAVVAARERGLVLVALAAGPPPREGIDRPACAVWPLGELVELLSAVAPKDAYGHFLAQLRAHLAGRAGWSPAAAPPPPPARPEVPPPPPPLPARPDPAPRTATRPVPSPAYGFAGGGDDWVAQMLAREALEQPAAPPPPPPRTTTRKVPRAEVAPPPAPPLPEPPAALSESRLAGDLDMADQVEGARAVREVLAAVQKAIHTFRLYPREHPFCAEAIEAMAHALQRFLDRHGTLDLEVQRDGVAFRGQRLLDEQGRASDLSFLLYPEGIRSLSFEQGVEPRELSQLIETLAGQDPTLIADQDLLGALWRRELTHVNYLTFDQLSPSALRGKLDTTLQGLAARILTLSAELTRSSPESDAALESLLREEPPADTDALRATRAELALAHRAGPAGAGRQGLVDQLQDAFQGDLLGRAVDVVAFASASEDEEPDPSDVGHFLGGAVVNVLWLGDLAKAGDLLGRAEAAGALHPELLGRLTSREALALFVRALRPRPDSPPPDETARKAALAYLARIGPGALDEIARLWGRLADVAVQGIVREFLAAHAAERPEALAPLTEHGEPRVATDALELLLPHAARPRVKQLLLGFAADASQPERARRSREALDALDAESPEGRLRRLLDQLEQAPTREERVEAANRLAELGAPGSFERLCGLVEKREFAAREPEEIDAVLGALTKLGGVRAVRILQELAERRTLIGRSQTQRISYAANAWLAELRRRRQT